MSDQPGPDGPAPDPPWSGWIETTGDALLILEAAKRGLIPRVTRRLVDSERRMITSGSVFVFDEDESGIKRWTDGFFWSPSRILGNFLLYRETDKKGTAHRPQQKSSDADEDHRNDDGSVSGGALSRPKDKNVPPGIDLTRERQLMGSLTNNYKFKQDGLVKKTFSLTIGGVAQHLISYYKIKDVEEGRLRTPSSLPELAALDISPDYLDKTNFRNPPKVELDRDGIPRYRGEAEDIDQPASAYGMGPMTGPLSSGTPLLSEGKRAVKRFEPYPAQGSGSLKRPRKSSSASSPQQSAASTSAVASPSSPQKPPQQQQQQPPPQPQQHGYPYPFPMMPTSPTQYSPPDSSTSTPATGTSQPAPYATPSGVPHPYNYYQYPPHMYAPYPPPHPAPMPHPGTTAPGSGTSAAPSQAQGAPAQPSSSTSPPPAPYPPPEAYFYYPHPGAPGSWGVPAYGYAPAPGAHPMGMGMAMGHVGHMGHMMPPHMAPPAQQPQHQGQQQQQQQQMASAHASVERAREGDASAGQPMQMQVQVAQGSHTDLGVGASAVGIVA